MNVLGIEQAETLKIWMSIAKNSIVSDFVAIVGLWPPIEELLGGLPVL